MKDWIVTESSNIHKIAWKKNKLYIKFKSGGKYEYVDVSQKTYNSLLNSKSKGRFFLKNIKEKYNYNRI